MSEISKPAVSVLGLGAMGTALTQALLARSHLTTVWNRSAAKADALVTKGAAAAGSPAEAITASQLLIVCLLDHRSVHEVLDAHADALRGRVLVNLTSSTPAQARELAGWAAQRGIDFLDGGIMAIPPMIGAPGSLVLYSGSRSAFDAHRDVLDSFGESQYLGTDPGLAALQDIALLSGMYGMVMGVLHAFALVGTEGVPATAFAPLLSRWLDSMSGLVASTAEQIDKGDYTAGVVANLAMQEAAYGNLIQAARDQGISPELIAPLHSLMRRRVADGHGDEEFAGLIELLKLTPSAALKGVGDE